MVLSMLHYEFVKNDVAIRAQSLSYFTLFSILPLIAGIFLVLGFFSQWAPAQKEFEELMTGVLGSIPSDQREVLMSYILQFKDQYLQNLSQKSGRIGVFAILVLLWIGARVYFNVESLMNRIWSVRAERPWFERIKNFIVTMVFLPLIYALVISLPRIVEHLGNHHVGLFLDQGLLILVIFATLLALLKGFPFRLGTDTAYGKAGVLPVFAFFIYVGWLIFIFSVEVSLLVQRGPQMLERRLPSTTLGSALVLEKVLKFLEQRFERGDGPQQVQSICESLRMGEGTIGVALEYLERKSCVTRVRPPQGKEGELFQVSRILPEEDLSSLLREHLQTARISRHFDVEGLLQRLRAP